MSRYIVFVAMYISIIMLVRKGPQETFLKVLIPFFLFLPFMFWVNIPGLPDPNFMQAAILPLLFVLLSVMEWSLPQAVDAAGTTAPLAGSVRWLTRGR